MKKDVLKLSMLAFVLTGTALAGAVSTPEIDPGTMTVPLALIGGAVLIVRSRIRR
jgi:hypothetical protein